MLAAGCIHGDERIRRQAATNPNLTAAQLTQLARDPDENVRRLAWTHTNAGQEQLFSAPLPYLLGLSHIPSYRFDALARDTVQVALAFCRDGWSDTLGALIDTARMLTT